MSERVCVIESERERVWVCVFVRVCVLGCVCDREGVCVCG